MIKLIVADFDGTLMPFGQTEVSAIVKNQIETALKKNISFAVSSGRTYSELAHYLPEFVDRIWFICCDGAYYVKEGRTYYEKQITNADIDWMFRANGEGASFVFHGAFENYAIGELPDEGRRFHGKTLTRAEARLPKEKIYKITGYGAKAPLAPYSGLRMHWDGGPNESSQYVNRFADKGAALSDLQIRLFKSKFETACIGDSGNDVAMMHNAKYSYCVGTRSEELVRVCTHHVATAEEALTELLN
ncbi:MAG: HAD family phosphatase [Clostridia bacterium]|nr:HAD family phosphatase [Clostridia bacterium]